MRLSLVVLMFIVSCGRPEPMPKPYVNLWSNDNLTCSKFDNGGIDGTQIIYPIQFCTVGRGFLVGITQKYR